MKSPRINTRAFSEMMGRRVLVRRTLRRSVEEGQAWWEVCALPEPRTGWIVGLRWVLNGEISDYYSPEEPATFAETGRQPAILVAWWPTEAPVHVPFDSIDLEVVEDMPEPYTSAGYGVGAERRAMRKLASDMSPEWYRDTRGRWKKSAAA